MCEREEKKKCKEKEAKAKDAKAAEKEAKKQKYIEEEEEIFVDDEDCDPDFDPDKEFIESDDMVTDDEDEEDTFQVHKHSHALNFSEAGDFVVWVRDELEELQRAVRRGKNMDTHYKTFVTILKDAVVKMGSWGPIAGADMDVVVKTVIDVNCTAWRKAMQGIKTGNSKTIMKIKEKREGVIRVIEDKEIPIEDDTAVVDPYKIPGKMEEEKKEIKRMLRKFWMHIQKAHEEAACAAGELSHLSMVLELDNYYKVVEAGTHPIITMEIPKVKQMVAQQKEIEERARSHDEMRNTRIEDIIVEQNLQMLLERWKDSKVLLPTQYLVAVVHYFVYLQADQKNPMMNKFVSDKFNLSSSNLHRIITGRCYAGGHETAKTMPEDHGEKFVKVAKVQSETCKGKGNGRGKTSSATASAAKGSAKPSESKVTVTKVPPKLVTLLFLEEPPAEGTHGAKRRKKDDGSKGQK